MQPKDIIEFWFEEIKPLQWWRKSGIFDAEIARRFSHTLQAARNNDLAHWLESPLGCLALIIVLDQFSRNIFRDQPSAFLADEQALAIAQFALEKGYDQRLNNLQRQFLYMPFMHSEDAQIHQQAVELFASLEGENSADFELRHKAIIDRFGRYPHRNAILGRESTAEELAFLTQPGSGF